MLHLQSRLTSMDSQLLLRDDRIATLQRNLNMLQAELVESDARQQETMHENQRLQVRLSHCNVYRVWCTCM